MGRSSDRDERVDRLLAGAFDAPRTGRWLIAGALPRVEAALEERGAEVIRWSRFAGSALGSAGATPAPVGEGYDGAVVRLPRGAEAAWMTLHLVAGRLAPGGELWVGGANDEGIRGVERRLGEVVREVGEGVPGGHARRIGGRTPQPGLRADLEQWAETVPLRIEGQDRAWTSWPGLFAHGRLDEGTRLLLEHLPDPRGLVALDFACGTGLVAEVLRSRGAAAVEACDHDALAVHAARRNVPAATVRCVDGLPDGSWELVASNPPIHRGADPDWSVLQRLAEGLPAKLRPGGSVYLVTQVTVPVRTLFAGRFAAIAPVARDRSFTVWRLANSNP